MKSSMRVLVAVLVIALVGGGCAARQGTAPTRATPAGTVEVFKMKARYGDSHGEWDILSPDFKRRISEQAGRNVDVADYTQARQMFRSDPKVQLAERMLQTAVATQVQRVGQDRARVMIRTSGGPLAKSGAIGMVRLSIWRLRVAGEPEPYQGYVGDPAFVATKQPDGSYVVTANGNAVATVPASQVQGYEVESNWYVDDLGGMEQQFFAP